MEPTTLNLILVGSFGFVSIALGVRWLGQTILEYQLTKKAIDENRVEIREISEEELMKLMGEDDDDFTR